MAWESFNTGISGRHEAVQSVGRSKSIADRSTGDISLMTSELSRLLEQQSKLLESPLLGPYLFLYDQQSEEIQNLFFRIIASQAQPRAAYPIRDPFRNSAPSPPAIPNSPNLQVAEHAKYFGGSIGLFLRGVLVEMYEAIASLNPRSWRSHASKSDSPAPLKF